MCENKISENDINNFLFNEFCSINDYLLLKESKQKLSALDCFAFQGTTYAMSLLRNRINGNVQSLDRCFIIRCLIENVAVINMIKKEKIEIDINLLNTFNYIAEYRVYKKYEKTLNNLTFNFDQIQDNYNKTFNLYKRKYKLKSEHAVKEKIKTIMPFLNESYNFKDIVKKYYNDFYEYYILFSFYSHPYQADLFLMLNDENCNFTHIENAIFSNFYDLISKKYSNVKNTNKFLTAEVQDLLSSSYRQKLRRYAKNQENALIEISNLIEDYFGITNDSCFVKQMAYLISSCNYDNLFGSNEIIKCKYKFAIELITYNLLIELKNRSLKTRYEIEIIRLHSIVYLCHAIGDVKKEEQRADEAYRIYCQHNESIPKEDFIRSFSKPMGFLKKDKKISTLVSNILHRFLLDDVKNNFANLLYSESIYLTHANGYMLIANNGAFGEYEPCIFFIEELIGDYLEMYLGDCQSMLKDEPNNLELKKLVNRLEILFNEYLENMNKKINFDSMIKNIKVKY